MLNKLLKDIKDKKELLEVAESLREYAKAEGMCIVSVRGNFRTTFDYLELKPLIENRIDELMREIDHLEAAKDAAEKTAKGWLNQVDQK